MNASKKTLSVVLTSILCACGGGGDDGPAAAVPEGLYIGTADGDRSVVGLILNDGTYYFIYSAAGVPTRAAGVVQGSGGVSSDRFLSSNARDFNIEHLHVFAAQLAADYAKNSSLTGTLSYDTGDTLKFKTTYNPDFQKVPTVAAIVGNYGGNVAFSEGSEGAAVTINAGGTLKALGDSGCRASGNVLPRSDGNVYDLAITFGGAPCLHAGETFHGIAYLDAANNRLYAAAPNAARDDGVLFIGVLTP